LAFLKAKNEPERITSPNRLGEVILSVDAVLDDFALPELGYLLRVLIERGIDRIGNADAAEVKICFWRVLPSNCRTGGLTFHL
jgi:hypothetical protein